MLSNFFMTYLLKVQNYTLISYYSKFLCHYSFKSEENEEFMKFQRYQFHRCSTCSEVYTQENEQ